MNYLPHNPICAGAANLPRLGASRISAAQLGTLLHPKSVAQAIGGPENFCLGLTRRRGASGEPQVHAFVKKNLKPDESPFFFGTPKGDNEAEMP
jgi:hypothetical protein